MLLAQSLNGDADGTFTQSVRSFYHSPALDVDVDFSRHCARLGIGRYIVYSQHKSVNTHLIAHARA